MKIAIIADDFTGAAEAAGIGHRHGLPAEVSFHALRDAAAALAIDTDTRLCRPHAARLALRAEGERLARFGKQLIFKKVDSVLRGNVYAESAALAGALGKAGVILVPANPAMGRIIRDGRCYVRGIPVARTFFRDDPHHPIKDSRIGQMLGAADRVVVRRTGERARVGQFTVGEAACEEDLGYWASQVDDRFLPAGGGIPGGRHSGGGLDGAQATVFGAPVLSCAIDCRVGFRSVPKPLDKDPQAGRSCCSHAPPVAQPALDHIFLAGRMDRPNPWSIVGGASGRCRRRRLCPGAPVRHLPWNSRGFCRPRRAASAFAGVPSPYDRGRRNGGGDLATPGMEPPVCCKRVGPRRRVAAPFRSKGHSRHREARQLRMAGIVFLARQLLDKAACPSPIHLS